MHVLAVFCTALSEEEHLGAYRSVQAVVASVRGSFPFPNGISLPLSAAAVACGSRGTILKGGGSWQCTGAKRNVCRLVAMCRGLPVNHR